MSADCYCAQIENDAVTNVIVCGCAEWATQHLGGQWICTGERLVGVGWPVVDGEIVLPQPYPSWTLNEESLQWEPPVPMPQDGGPHVWDEDAQAWVAPPEAQ